METARSVPPPTSAGVRRRRLTLGLLLAVVAATVPSLLLSQWATKQFWVGPALLASTGAAVGPGATQCGRLAVVRDHHYQIDLRLVGTLPFTAFLAYADGSESKHYVPPISFDETAEMDPIIRAARDDPAAALVLAPLPSGASPAPLALRKAEVHEIRSVYYVWRTLVHTGRALVLLTGLSIAGWQLYRLWVGPSEDGSGDARLRRRVAGWSVGLLTLMTGAGIFLVQDQHAHLFLQPPTPSISGWDGSFYYFWLRSAMVEGDVDFAKDLRYCNSMPLELREATLRDSPRTRLGLIPNKYPIGWALFEVPWYVGADTVARVVNATGGDVRRDGWGTLYQVFLVAGQVAYAVAGLWLASRVLAEFLPPVFAAAGVALGWLCSPLAYYQTIGVSMAHNVMFLAVAGTCLAALRLRKDPDRLRWWVLVGVGCALAILSRYQGAVLLLFPGVVCLQAVWNAPRRWTHLAVGIAASAVPLAVQAFAWKALYGSYFLYTYEGEGFDWGSPHLWESLFSSYHGLFNWHPALLAGFLGFAAWAARTPDRTAAACFAASLGLTIYVNSAWQCWWFGDSFGGRAYDGCLLFAMLGFGWTLHALARRAALFHVAAALGVLAALWSMNLLWLSRDGSLSISRPIPWQEKIELTRRYWLHGS